MAVSLGTLLSARAAFGGGTFLLLETHAVGDLHECGFEFNQSSLASLCLGDSLCQVTTSARAASLLLVGQIASGLLALQFALGTRAGGGFSARPVALGLLAQGGAVGLRGDAGGVAFGGGADGLALRAAVLLAHVLGATNRALRLFAVHGALGAFGLLALHFALRTCANRVALGRAHRVIALPAALRVAADFQRLSRRDGEENSNSQQQSTHTE